MLFLSENHEFRISNFEEYLVQGNTKWIPFLLTGKIHTWNVGTYDLTPWRLTLNVGDYYTRDRSTPRRDEFYGGNDDLTAAVGWEENGVTTIMFR